MIGIPSFVALARKRVNPGLARVARGNRGGMFIETIIAIGIFTIVGVAVLTGYATTQRTGAVSGITIPSYFIMTATGEEVEAGVTAIQKVIVTVSWSGSPYWTLESLYSQN